MQVLITGGTGFVGRHATAYFLDRGHKVTSIGTRSAFAHGDHPDCLYIQADTTQPGHWQEAVAQADLVLNLAGQSIFRRWTKRQKTKIRDSRILTTRNLVDALPAKGNAVLISTSAVGYYGDGGEATLTEAAPNGSDFLAGLAREWEAAAMTAGAKGIRVAIARFGIVLGRDDGALAKMLPAFRAFVGGPLGSGRQWFPWIHVDDLVAAMAFVYERPELEGVFNFVGPNPVRNRAFAQALGRALGRPAVMAVPDMALKLLMGELAGTLLASQRAVPAKLLAGGFQFRYPVLETALADLLDGSAQ